MERYIFIAHGLEETILLTCQYFNFSYMSKDSTKFQTKSQQGSRIFFFLVEIKNRILKFM